MVEVIPTGGLRAARALLRSFWMGGFEGADHRNARGEALDMARITGHAALLDADFARCARIGLHTVRESVGWRLSEPQAARYDFDRLQRVAEAGRRHGVQVLWTLMHYGMPDDLHVLHPQFARRFAAFARAAVQALHDSGAADDAPLIVTPINEIGFLAWVLSHTRRIAGGPPQLEGDGQESSRRSGYEIKCRLVEAAIGAMQAMREVDPSIRFLHVEPLVHVVAPPDAPELACEADEVASYQWQVWDLFAGRLDPQFGGAPRWLDLVGVNHYHDGQWELGTEKRLKWHLKDPRRKPFSQLALAAWQRYRRPMLVAETSHVGIGRAAWLDDIAREIEHLRRLGVPLDGVCLYPVIDRPSWENLDHWHNSGLWDATTAHTGPDAQRRALCRPYAKALRRWQRRLPDLPLTQASLKREQPMKSPLIVFSHLRWDFVYQRPQHLLSRIAHQHRVIFVEEPCFEAGATPHFEYRTPCDNVLVLRPITDVQAGGFHDDQLKVLKPLVQQLLHDEGLEEYLVWFYTPMALPLLAELQPLAVIYDCMDELAAFKGAPRQMRQRESALLKRADLVLTGGPSLYQGKRDANPHVYCLPSSVDAAHYAPERITQHCDEYLAAEQLQGHILAPRIGFFGVIDERLDLGLVTALAEAHPEWHVVMVGPIAKIDPERLPRHDNLHWLGQQPYARLPALVAGWDVCILPFALNEHTRFISPTKTLEYLAAEKPVVSTPVNDVVSMYGDVVRIAGSVDDFVQACADALAETPQQRADRLVHSAATVSRFSWDESARTVLRLMSEAVERGRAAPWTGPQVLADAGGDGVAETLTLSADTGAAPRAVRHLVIGAGPAGLAAAQALSQHDDDLLLVEREDRVGGSVRTIEVEGFSFEQVPFALFDHDTELQALYGSLLGANLHWQPCRAAVATGEVLARHPVERALHDLPLAQRQAALVGLVQSQARAARDGALAAAPRLDEFARRVWGEALAEQLVLPYHEKLWGLPLAELESSWLATRVRPAPLAEVVGGALAERPLMAPRLGQPRQGGVQALMNAFLLHLKGELALNTKLVKLSPQQRTVLLDDGRTVRYETLISTMPLPALIAACEDEAPPVVLAAARALRHVSLRCVHLGLERPGITDRHWIHSPGDTVFHRLVAPDNLRGQPNAAGGFALTAEITHSPNKPLPCDGAELVERVVADARRIGVLHDDDRVRVAHQVDLPCAYVVSDHARAAHVQLIREWLGRHGIVLAGRHGEWATYPAEQAFLAGRRAAEQALEARRLLLQARARHDAGASADGVDGRRAAVGGAADALRVSP